MEPIQGAEDVTDEAPDAPPDGLVVAWSYDSDEAVLLLQASTNFMAGVLNAHDELVIPDSARTLVEDGIREYADLLSVVYQCQRLIRSPSPCIAVRADGEDERALIAQATGIAAPPAVSAASPPSPRAPPGRAVWRAGLRPARRSSHAR